MTERLRIQQILSSNRPEDDIVVSGWVRTRRDAKDFSFLEINDGSCLKNLQVIADRSLPNYDEVNRLNTGSAITVSGSLQASPGKGQKWELQAGRIDIVSPAPEDYPLQKKRHTDEFLRTIAHLRPRTNKYGAVFRVRSELSYAIHQFFRDSGFYYIHTPILTASDCEGAGKLFQVTTLDMANLPRASGQPDYTGDFFGKAAGMTVSGQLEAEMFALALGRVYTFGPTFRAENSNTSRHAAEFWMVEPEMAFCDLTANMDLAESFLKHLISTVARNCAEDIELFKNFVDKNLGETLDNIVNHDFVRIPYDEAVDILTTSGTTFEFPPVWGHDLQSEHERYLTERHFKKPVIVFNYPARLKPFYMRVNDDGRTVAAMDVLAPRIGEIIGGSQREERLDVLKSRMTSMGLSPEDYWWYLDSRRFGSVPHSGFGLGFERLLMLLTGITNIRDVIPFPRTPGNIEF
ncbi:MAG: asparagine--tRNA ligase [Thermodesulfobacteriota bacterium]